MEEENPDLLADAKDHLNQAYLLEEEGKLKAALEECDASIEVCRPLLADAYNLRGIILEEMERDEAAIEEYKKAILIEPGFRDAADNLSALESEVGLKHHLVTIATFSHPTEAYVLKSRLEAEGIWSFVADEYTVTMYWLYSNAVGGVKLQVKGQDVEKAREILGLEQTSFEDELVAEDEEPRCPNCNSSNVHYERYAKRGLFASWLILSFPIPFLKRTWKCGDCGHEWKI